MGSNLCIANNLLSLLFDCGTSVVPHTQKLNHNRLGGFTLLGGFVLLVVWKVGISFALV
jgi:hypothetical protein